MTPGHERKDWADQDEIDGSEEVAQQNTAAPGMTAVDASCVQTKGQLPERRTRQRLAEISDDARDSERAESERNEARFVAARKRLKTAIESIEAERRENEGDAEEIDKERAEPRTQVQWNVPKDVPEWRARLAALPGRLLVRRRVGRQRRLLRHRWNRLRECAWIRRASRRLVHRTICFNDRRPIPSSLIFSLPYSIGSGELRRFMRIGGTAAPSRKCKSIRRKTLRWTSYCKTSKNIAFPISRHGTSWHGPVHCTPGLQRRPILRKPNAGVHTVQL